MKVLCFEKKLDIPKYAYIVMMIILVYLNFFMKLCLQTDITVYM